MTGTDCTVSPPSFWGRRPQHKLPSEEHHAPAEHPDEAQDNVARRLCDALRPSTPRDDKEAAGTVMPTDRALGAYAGHPIRLTSRVSGGAVLTPSFPRRRFPRR